MRLPLSFCLLNLPASRPLYRRATPHRNPRSPSNTVVGGGGGGGTGDVSLD